MFSEIYHMAPLSEYVQIIIAYLMASHTRVSVEHALK